MKKDTILVFIIITGLLVLPPAAHGLSIKSVDFMNVEDKSRLQIGLDEQATYDVSREGNSVVLRINKAHIPSHLARPYITSEFATAIEQILPSQDKGDVVFNIDMKQATPYFVSQDNKLLIMDFDIPADVKAKAQETKTVTVNKTPLIASAPAKLPAQPYIKGVSPEPALQSTIIDTDTSPKYKGERITLDFQNADIHNILRIIADVSGLNIVTSDEVKGSVTIRLKDVPWDQALDVVLESKDLDKMAIGNVVRIAPADKIKQAQERQLASKKTQEQLEPLVTSVIPVNFAKASDVAGTIKGKEVGLLSERGNITAENRTNVLIVKDIRKSVDEINAMVKRLDKPTPQVLISARIVQADSNFTRGLGIQWGGSVRSQSGKSLFGLSGLSSSTTAANPFDTAVTAGGAASWSSSYVPTSSYAVNFPMNQASGFGITLGRLGSNSATLDLNLDIGETTGTVNVLSRPKVVTLDNKKAIIRQGEKYPYIVRDTEGELSTELKDIDLVLEVTPRIAFDGSVNMEVNVKRNSIGSYTNQLGDPSISAREAVTEVLVKNGETSVIGGIIEEEDRDNKSQIPFLGDLPVIGYLFKGTEEIKTKKELLIFITPQILEPVALQ
ncbi:MAG TPA: type IV pilus secretin PilQ [Deltaproteobacteria bacterium]|nr:type IV pilus secretin PilQ [Deltaproteobacteria bacterium]HPR54364.1 type IV pilus secretin PilQ [Deltaproteobacteria bacterium]HXK46997.1 type IV pilus secretin PilQ [Deltaproteobacteria bacterium]